MASGLQIEFSVAGDWCPKTAAVQFGVAEYFAFLFCRFDDVEATLGARV
jgi:hypothetical protein